MKNTMKFMYVLLISSTMMFAQSTDKRNLDFEEGLSIGWKPLIQSNGTIGEASLETKDVQNGKQALKLHVSNGGKQPAQLRYVQLNRVSFKPEELQGKKVTFYAKTSKRSKKPRFILEIICIDAANRSIGKKANKLGMYKVTEQWEKYELTFDAGKNFNKISSVSLRFSLGNGATFSNDDTTFLIDNIQIE